MNKTLPVYLTKFTISFEIMVLGVLENFFKENEYLIQEKLNVQSIRDTLEAMLTEKEPDFMSSPVHFDPYPLNYFVVKGRSYHPEFKEDILEFFSGGCIKGLVYNPMGNAFSFRLEDEAGHELEADEIRMKSDEEGQFEWEIHLSGNLAPGRYSLHLFSVAPAEQSRQSDCYGYYPDGAQFTLVVR